MKAVGFIVPKQKLCNFMDFGHSNGYVAVSPDSVVHGKHYDLLENISVHGGLTFSEPVINKERTFVGDFLIRPEYVGRRNSLLDSAIEVSGSLSDIEDDWWIVGFDTCHYGDNSENWSEDRVIEEVKRLMDQIENLDNSFIETSKMMSGQFTTKEQTKSLISAGVPESIASCRVEFDSTLGIRLSPIPGSEIEDQNPSFEVTFSFSDLVSRLPSRVGRYSLFMRKYRDLWVVGYSLEVEGCYEVLFQDSAPDLLSAIVDMLVSHYDKEIIFR